MAATAMSGEGLCAASGCAEARWRPRSAMTADSHNLCVIGADDADLAVAANRLIALGGFVAVCAAERWWRSWRCRSPGW